VDLTHPCFEGADLKRPGSHWTDGKKVIPEAIEHATHITSLLVGQPGTIVEGIAPRCRCINVPVIYDQASMLEPIALTHAINDAFRAGADIIHIASCIPTKSGRADDMVARAIQNCIDNNVLVVAPAGNDKGECFCVPAIIPGVLAVGAYENEETAARFSNWGGIYQKQGILAPGIDIVGAAPGGGTSTHKGTSCAAPIVTGVAALLMSIQLSEGWPINARNVRDALLSSATPSDAPELEERERCLAGFLNVPGSLKKLFALSSTKNCASCSKPALPHPDSPAKVGPSYLAPRLLRSIGPTDTNRLRSSRLADVSAPGVSPSDCDCGGDGKGLVFFIGLVGYDFGTEARRDTFKQQMPAVWYRNVDGRDEFQYAEDLTAEALQALEGAGFRGVPANPYDARQMVAYLKFRPDEASSLIWTLNLELTPVYSVTPVGPFANRVYDLLVSMLDGQSQSIESASYVERVSIPAVLSGHSVRLFSGQEVSQLWVDAPRGMYSWRTTDLLARATPAIAAAAASAPASPVRDTPEEILRMVLNKLYYEYRNLGVTSPDRALNFAATNIFSLTGVLAEAIAKGKQLDRIDVVKSPYGRIDSDCWDVQLKFMDPENTNRAYTVFRFTIDVSDKLPVTMGKVVAYTSTR
jgi:hypothetical protein